MSWVERSVEERLAKAAAAGELDTPHLAGRQLDLDRPRRQGWWAEEFVRRERSHDRREIVRRAAEAARVGFWRAETEGAVRDLVAAANRAIADGNVHLVRADRIEPFDVVDVVDRWRRLRRRRPA